MVGNISIGAVATGTNATIVVVVVVVVASAVGVARYLTVPFNDATVIRVVAGTIEPDVVVVVGIGTGRSGWRAFPESKMLVTVE